MIRTLPSSFAIALVFGVAAFLPACSLPNAAAPGPSSIAADATNQLWVIDTGKIYRCSANGGTLNCQQATTNIR